jgi:hypothetical protein
MQAKYAEMEMKY